MTADLISKSHFSQTKIKHYPPGHQRNKVKIYHLKREKRDEKSLTVPGRLSRHLVLIVKTSTYHFTKHFFRAFTSVIAPSAELKISQNNIQNREGERGIVKDFVLGMVDGAAESLSILWHSWLTRTGSRGIEAQQYNSIIFKNNFAS